MRNIAGKNVKVAVIKEFPQDGRIWRINWLGAVHRSSATAEVKIDVLLSPEKMDLASIGRQEVLEQKHFDGKTCLNVQVGVGLLPFLTIGSLWKKGQLLPRTVGREERFSHVHINHDSKDSIKSVRFGKLLSETPKRWLVPDFSLQIPHKYWDLPCFAINYGGDPYGIVLPAIEVIRFYYAVSSDLAHIMFDGTLQQDLGRVIDPSVSGGEDGKRMVLRLRNWLADDDAWVIGRILADSNAYEGMEHIYSSIIKEKNQKNPRQAVLYPHSRLPFKGETNWHARCIEMPALPNQKRSRWLIQELVQCSAPFPFEEFELMRDNDNTKAPAETDIPDYEKRLAWPGLHVRPRLDETAHVQSDESPSISFMSVKVMLVLSLA